MPLFVCLLFNVKFETIMMETSPLLKKNRKTLELTLMSKTDRHGYNSTGYAACKILEIWICIMCSADYNHEYVNCIFLNVTRRKLINYFCSEICLQDNLKYSQRTCKTVKCWTNYTPPFRFYTANMPTFSYYSIFLKL